MEGLEATKMTFRSPKQFNSLYFHVNVNRHVDADPPLNDNGNDLRKLIAIANFDGGPQQKQNSMDSKWHSIDETTDQSWCYFFIQQMIENGIEWEGKMRFIL